MRDGPKYYVQSSQVRGERRSYWIERRSDFPSYLCRGECVEDFGTNKRKAEKRCAELNAAARRLEQAAIMNFPPVTTFDDLDGLDHDQMVEGYLSAERGDPEPGENRGRSYWHGWRCRMMDYGLIVPDEGHRRLVREYLAHQRLTQS